MFTVSAGVIYMRPFAIDFKKSGTRVSFIYFVLFITPYARLLLLVELAIDLFMHMIALLPVT